MSSSCNFSFQCLSCIANASAVYFNPAKTVGAMLEGDLFCLLGLLYAAVVCFVSMSMFWWLEVKPGWEWMADVVALVWIGLSIGLMAWMKVWMVGSVVKVYPSFLLLIYFPRRTLPSTLARIYFYYSPFYAHFGCKYSLQHDGHHHLCCVSILSGVLTCNPNLTSLKCRQRGWSLRSDSGLRYCCMWFCRLELGLLSFMAPDCHIQLAAEHDPDP